MEQNFKLMFQSLIATPSVSASVPQLDMSNQGVINLLANWCEARGFKVDVSALESAPNKYNLAATIGAGSGGLMLAGHTDTVPFDDSRWESDPFELNERDNRWYGLGSIDMKGFFAFALWAFDELVAELGVDAIKKPLMLLATADEETTMAGAQEFCKHSNLKPEKCVIGEPTNMVPVYAHKGHMSAAIRITGRSGHSSDPSAGLNAIEIMHLVIAELLKLREELKNKYSKVDFAIPYPTLNLGHIHGGDNANRICGCCELHIDLRPIPGISINELKMLLTNAVKQINQTYPNAVDIIDLHDPIPAFSGSADMALVKLAERLSGNQAQTVNYCTEAPFIQQLGCETIVMGPGSIMQAHQPNEYMPVEQIKPSKEIIKRLIFEVCFN